MKRLILLTASIFLMLSTQKAHAQDFFAINNDADTIYYNITSPTPPLTVEVTKDNLTGTNYVGDIAIPDSVIYGGNTYAVTAIGWAAFVDCLDLISVIIPNSVMIIDIFAFSGCTGLASVTIGNSVTSIGISAFYNCSGLTSITIPNSVMIIEGYAFSDCTGLTSIDVEPNNSNYSSIDGVLFNKLQNTLLQYPGGKTGSYTIPNSVTAIGDNAFENCFWLTSVTIPNSVITIGDNAFSWCDRLTGTLTIPNSVKTIGIEAFSRCSGLTGTLTIPNSVTSIGNFSFSECHDITSITISNSVTIIGDGAFFNCRSLTSVSIPNSVTTIGHSCFSHCRDLTTVTIPHSVTTIDNFVFFNCDGLTEIYVRAEVPPSLGSMVFWNVPDTIPVYVPCGKETAYKNVYGWHSFTNITSETPLPDIILQSNDATMGTVDIIQANTCTNDTAIIKATPNTGYRFLQWNDGNRENPRTVIVTQDITYTATFDVETGITDIEASALTIYPNPATDNICIILPENVHSAVFTLYDMQGKILIKQEVSNKETVAIDKFASGIYIYSVRTDKQNHTGKLIRK